MALLNQEDHSSFPVSTKICFSSYSMQNYKVSEHEQCRPRRWISLGLLPIHAHPVSFPHPHLKMQRIWFMSIRRHTVTMKNKRGCLNVNSIIYIVVVRNSLIIIPKPLLSTPNNIAYFDQDTAQFPLNTHWAVKKKKPYPYNTARINCRQYELRVARLILYLTAQENCKA